jgi:hypothetical protein
VPGLAQQSSAASPEQANAKPGPAAGRQALDLQDLVARDVLEPLRDGIQTQNPGEVLAVFDAEAIPEFPQLRDQIRAFLDSYAVLRFRYKILQATSDRNGATVTCETDLDATPRDPADVPMRRSRQLRLQLKPTEKGWRISAFSPKDFFAQ